MEQQKSVLLSEKILEEKLKTKEDPENGIKLDLTDKIFAFFYWIVGYAFLEMMLSYWNFERNVSLFTIFYVTVVLAYCHCKKKVLTKEMWFWTGIVLAIGVPYMFWSAIPGLQFLVLIVTAGYWTYAVTGNLLSGRVSEWTAADVWNAMVWMPFANFGKQAKVIYLTVKRDESGKKLLPVLLGIVLAIPILAFAVPLLMSADRGFQEFILNFTGNININAGETVMKMIFSFIISSYLYGLLYGGSCHLINTEKEKKELQQIVANFRTIPNLTVNTAVTIVNALYLLFIIMQGRYLFSAFAGIRPEGYTYAEYARQGFFELCAIAAMNMTVFVLANAFSRQSYREHKMLRMCNVVLAVLTLVLIGTAMSKMGLYISAYGLTVKRILTSVFMLWMTIVFCLIIRKQKKSVQLMRWSVLAGAVLFAAICVIPIEKLIFS